MQPSSTRAALATPPGRGAVATIAIWGPEAWSATARHFQRGQPDDPPLQALLVGKWGAPPGEEVVAARMAADRVEVHCHGGQASAQRILADLEREGVHVAAWQEWVQSEYSPIEAEAAIALAQASTEMTALLLADQLAGALERDVQKVIASLEEATDDSLKAASVLLADLLDLWPAGRRLTTPFTVVLAGPPNVGKSTLLNAITGYARAIVDPTPGTTRDAISAVTALEGWPVELCDTAGLHASTDELEIAGMQVARRRLAACDVAILVFDRSQPLGSVGEELLREHPGALIVRNKADLPSTTQNLPAGLDISALRQSGLQELIAAIVRRLVPLVPPRQAGIPFTARQAYWLRRAAGALCAENVAGTLAALRACLLGEH